MTDSYELLTKCQAKLVQCDINEIERMYLEMCIIRAKVLLLEGNRNLKFLRAVDTGAQIEKLYQSICTLCGPDGNPDQVGAIIERLQQLIEEMKGK